MGAKRLLVAAAIAAVLLAVAGIGLTAPATAAPVPGKACPKAGAWVKIKGKLYQCKKSGARKVWTAQVVGPSTTKCPGAIKDNASIVGKPPSSTKNKTVVIAQDNLWFHGLRIDSAFVAWDGSGQYTSHYEPWNGYYNTSVRDDNERRIALAADNGVDAFSQEWISPRGEPGSLEGDLDDAFLTARNLCRIKWAIFYDLNLRLWWSGDRSSGPPNFDNPGVRDLFVKDFVHFAEKYFSQAQYLKIDGRPVVEIWATWNFRGSVDNIQAAVLAARNAVKQAGYDVYIVADEEFSGEIDKRRIATWDATSSFIPMLMGGSPFGTKDNGTKGLSAINAWVDQANAAWVAATAGVTVVGSGNPVSFQPGYSPQYDDTVFRRVNNLPDPTSLLAMGPQDIKDGAQVALKYAQPVGQTGRGMIWVGTLNGYPESTQIESTKPGTTWPAANYGNAIYDATSSVWGKEVFGD